MRGIFFGVAGMILAVSARGQTVLPGHSAGDKFLAAFWSQNSNASNLVQGVNQNHGTNRFLTDILPLVMSGSSLSGDWLGTNTFRLKTWDATAGAFQVFDFNLLNQIPQSTNAVSRIAFPETNTFKIFNNWRFQTNGVNQSGVLVSKGTSYGMAVSGVSGTWRIYTQVEYDAATPTTWVEFQEGVLTGLE